MPESAQQFEEKREYFRIDDQSQLAYQIVTAAEATLKKQSLSPQLKQRAKWMEDLEDIDRVSASALTDVYEQSAGLVTYLNALNQKIQILLEALIEISTQNENTPLQHINISEGGMAFNSQEYIAPQTYLAISLLLRPTSRPFLCIAGVVTCQVLDGEGDLAYRIGVNFTDIQDTDRQTLSAHILRLQMVRRRAQTDLSSAHHSEDS